MRAETSTSVYRIELTRPDWNRTLRFRSHDDRKGHRSRLEILEPRKSKGTLFLRIENKLSMVLPKLRREFAISPAMMLDPWMGSDFNNQDLLEVGALIEDYSHQIIAREANSEFSVITIESRPAPGSKVVWNRLVQRIRADGLPLEVEYFDDEGRALRRLSFHDLKTFGDREIPTRWVMVPLDKDGYQSVIIIENIAFDVEIPDKLFKDLVTKRKGSE